jgi:hypothetical protein
MFDFSNTIVSILYGLMICGVVYYAYAMLVDNSNTSTCDGITVHETYIAAEDDTESETENDIEEQGKTKNENDDNLDKILEHLPSQLGKNINCNIEKITMGDTDKPNTLNDTDNVEENKLTTQDKYSLDNVKSIYSDSDDSSLNESDIEDNSEIDNQPKMFDETNQNSNNSKLDNNNKLRMRKINLIKNSETS